MGSAVLQGRLGGAAARDWARRQEIFSLPIWTALLDTTRVRPRMRLLDAGCGAGGGCVEAVRRGAARRSRTMVRKRDPCQDPAQLYCMPNYR
jgi:hypothetical protein